MAPAKSTAASPTSASAGRSTASGDSTAPQRSRGSARSRSAGATGGATKRTAAAGTDAKGAGAKGGAAKGGTGTGAKGGAAKSTAKGGTARTATPAPKSAAGQSRNARSEPKTTKVTRVSAGRPAPSGRTAVAAARGRPTAGLDRSGRAHGHSAVELLLAEHVAPDEAPGEPAEPAESGSAARPRRQRPVPEQVAHAPLPPVQDVLLGLACVIGEHAWRWGTHAVTTASEVTARTIALVRGVAPGYATAQVESGLVSLAERGQRVRRERTEALTTTVTAAVTTAASSDAVREMTVAAIEEATDDVLAVMLPAVLEAVSELETQERLDELMAGLLLRQLPSALEKTLPGVMLRTATRPALGLVPFLGGSSPRGQ